MNWKKIKRIHFVGIKGVAMAALSIWAKEAGYAVTGSDVRDEFPTDEVLEKAKITVIPDFDPRNLVGAIKPDLVIYTGAHGGRENPEVVEAAALGIETLPHGKALGEIMAGKRQISVAGSHGKTTTSAMIATILSQSGHDPSWAIGCGFVRGLGLPGHHGKGRFFVAEADEYITDPKHDDTPRFLWQKPEILVVTNIDYDHPDAYASIEQVQSAFALLAKKSSLVIKNADDKASRGLAGVTYGFTPEAEYRVGDVHFEEERTFFTLYQNNQRVFDFTLRVPGSHNALNASAAAIACHECGLSWKDIGGGLHAFGGTKRRFELVGEVGGIKIIDDYAHHPNEIKATLAAARLWYPDRRIIAVFQPHTYSRTKVLMSEFARAFASADDVILTEIYASARETETLGISGTTLVEETAKNHRNVFFAPDFNAVSKKLRAMMQPRDVIIFMGAGDIYGYSRKFI